MFRDDQIAAIARVDALQRAVDRLQIELYVERAENDRLRLSLREGPGARRLRRRFFSSPLGAVVGGALVGLAASTAALLLLS